MSFDQELVDIFHSKTGLEFQVPQTDDGYDLIHRDVHIRVHIIDKIQVIKSAEGENRELVQKIVQELTEQDCGPYYHSEWKIDDELFKVA